jgi:hypothetical protein
MAMSMDQVAKELKKLGDYQGVLGTALHWLKTQGTLKPMRMKDVDNLIQAIEDVLPQDVLDAVEEGVSNELDSYNDVSYADLIEDN